MVVWPGINESKKKIKYAQLWRMATIPCNCNPAELIQKIFKDIIIALYLLNRQWKLKRTQVPCLPPVLLSGWTKSFFLVTFIASNFISKTEEVICNGPLIIRRHSLFHKSQLISLSTTSKQLQCYPTIFWFYNTYSVCRNMVWKCT